MPEKRVLAMKLGATDAIDANDASAATILEMTKGGVDHAIEAVGRPASAATAVASLRRGGTATILGMMPLGEKVGLSAMDLLQSKKLQGAIMGGNRFPVDIPRLVDFYLRGLLDLDTIIAERIPLSAINDGFEVMKRGDAARSVIVFDQ
jgi:S-(hydroxymethyl)glutathione dehydrogenase/alcohol dehydrogenase